MAYQRPNPAGNNPAPRFAVELDGSHGAGMPVSPDGAPIFEMPAESASAASNKTDESRKQSQVQELDAGQANPWPYHGPGVNDDRPSANPASTIAAQDFAAGGVMQPGQQAAGELAPNTTGPSMVSAPDVPHDSRPSTVSPISPSAEQFFPAPLQIKRPPPQAPEPKYKPYSPNMSHEFQDAPRPPVTSSPPPTGHTSTVAYRPYRRPSYKETPAPAPAPAQVQSAHTSPGPASPPFEPPKASGTPPYPMGTAPHHFYMPASPVVSEGTRPSLSPRPGQQHSPMSAQGTGNSVVASPGPHAASPATSESKESAFRPPPAGQSISPPASRPEEIVLWPHPPGGHQAAAPAPAPAPVAAPVPNIPPQHTRPPAPPQDFQQQHLSPTHTGASSSSPVHGFSHPPAPPQDHQQHHSPTHASTSSTPPVHGYSRPPPHTQNSAPTSPGYIPQMAYGSSAPSGSPATSPPPQSHDRPEAGPRPSKFPTAEPQDPIPMEPPPAYSDIAPAQPGSQLPPNEKQSLFPQAPSSAPQTPTPTGFPQQSSYTSSSHTSPPPNHQPYGAPQPNLHPPPLPPRPGSSHSTSSHQNYPPQPQYAAQPTGLSGPAAPPGTFPRPPKTSYVPQHPQPSVSARPSYGNTYGNKFLGGSAKKWLDKTNHFVENKIGEVLTNHPDPKYRPQPGSYGYMGAPGQHLPPGQQQIPGQHQGPPGGYPQSPPPQGGYGQPQQPQYAQQPGPPGPRP